jgi:hypothetical protein
MLSKYNSLFCLYSFFPFAAMSADDRRQLKDSNSEFLYVVMRGSFDLLSLQSGGAAPSHCS